MGNVGDLAKNSCWADAVVVQDHSAEQHWVSPSPPADAARIVQRVQCLCPCSTLPSTFDQQYDWWDWNLLNSDSSAECSYH